MGIFLRHSWNIPPPHWGSPTDIRYAIKVNSEKIYNVDPDSNCIIMPFFWGFPLLDYSGRNNHAITNYGTLSKNGELYFDGSSYTSVRHQDFPVVTFTYSTRIRPKHIGVNRDIMGSQGGSLEYRMVSDGTMYLIRSGVTGIGQSTGALKLGITQSTVVTYDSSGNWAHFFDGIDVGNGTNLQTIDSPTYVYLGRSQYPEYFYGGMLDVRINATVFNGEQIALFSSLPYGLYQKVARPFYLLPIVDVTTTTPTTSPATTVAPTTLAPATTPVPTTPIYTTILPTTEFVATTPLPTTTLAPTTPQPTTIAPTTVVPTTLGPTTLVPTTVLPTTVAATTLLPTTLAPTTLLPTTVAPTSLAPTTLASTTIAPTSLAPTTVIPTTLVPTTITPTTVAPTTLVSTTLQPTTVAPTTIYPTTLIPTTVGPTTLPPTTLLPTTNIPEVICIKNLKSIITNEFITKSHITKELRIHGNLC